MWENGEKEREREEKGRQGGVASLDRLSSLPGATKEGGSEQLFCKLRGLLILIQR